MVASAELERPNLRQIRVDKPLRRRYHPRLLFFDRPVDRLERPTHRVLVPDACLAQVEVKMLWARLIPILFAASLVKTAVVGPPDMSQLFGVVERTRFGAQRGELRSYAEMLESDAVVGQGLPKLGDAEKLAAWLHENSQAKGRDVAVDLWGRPFLLEKLNESAALILSLGPNGVRDICVEGITYTDEDDDICERVDVTPEAIRKAK